MVGQLLATKLHLPAGPSQLVPRQRLIEFLNSNPQRKLTLISAPAGFGKTSLMVEWLEQLDRPVAWYSLDAGDNDPVQFARYLVHALQHLQPDLGAGLLPALQSQQPPALSFVVSTLLNELADQAVEGVLALDDLHVIEQPEVWQALNLLVENQPEGFHLAITTREDPSLALPRLRARRQLLEIRAEDLRFTVEEASTFLSEVMHIDLDPEQLRALEARTEGWIAGLQLAAISMRGEPDIAAFIQAFSGSHRFILDYLSSEVLQQLSPDVRQFVLHTSILERFSASLCNAVSEREDAAAILQQLEGMNLFLIQLDHERQWYRYHHLFADLLRKQLAQETPQEIPHLHIRASAWYEAQELIPEAVQHTIAAGDNRRLVELVEGHAIQAIMQGRIHLAKGWIEALPEAARQRNPRVLMDYAWALFLNGDFASIPKVVDQAEQLTPPAGVLGEVLTMRAFLSYEDPTQMKAYALQAQEIVPESNLMVRGLVAMALSNVYSQLEQKRDAFGQFAKAVDLHWAAGNRVAAMNALLDMVQIAMLVGNLADVRRLTQQSLERARQDGVQSEPATGLAYVGAGWIAVQQGRLDEGIAQLQAGLALAAPGGFSVADYGWLPLAQAQALAGDQPGARRSLKTVSDKLDLLHEGVRPYVLWHIVHTCLDTGDLAEAAAWLDRCEVFNSHDFPVVQARVAVKALGQPQQALDALSPVMPSWDPENWRGLLVDGLAVQAQARHALGDADVALADLTQALDYAEQDEIVFPFLRDGAELRPLLERLPKQPFTERILAAIRCRPDRTALADQGELSERERQILALMAEGLTYEEIAQRLIVSINTVRYHVKSLYGKLGVSSRSAAIAAARRQSH